MKKKTSSSLFKNTKVSLKYEEHETLFAKKKNVLKICVTDFSYDVCILSRRLVLLELQYQTNTEQQKTSKSILVGRGS